MSRKSIVLAAIGVALFGVFAGAAAVLAQDSAGSTRAVTLEPPPRDHGCTGKASLSLRQDAGGGIAFAFSGVSEDCIAQKPSMRLFLSLYTEAVPGLPAPVVPEQDKLTNREKMLVNGFCYEYWNGNPRSIQPLGTAAVALNMFWGTNGCLPAGEYGLLYPDKPAEYDREGAFWRQPERKQLTNAASFCNPLRNSIIRVNPPEERSPGDIYLEKLVLTGDQTEHLRPFAEKHHSATDRGYLLTVYGTSGQVLLRGILFMQPVKVVHLNW